MNPSAGDTLDIKPMAPASASFVAPSQSDDEVAAARAKIASMGTAPAGKAGEYILPGQTVSLRQPEAAPVAAQTIPQPVSPAAAVTGQLPKARPLKSGTRPAVPSALKPILSAIGSFIFLLVVFKSQIIFSQLKYLTSKPQTNSSSVAATTASAVIPAAPTISIPKINVNAPVVYEQSIQENDILTALQNGVVHYGTTPVPGQGGNMVIVGHSSNDWWEAGNYKFVFVLLDKLVVGDQFSINYQSHRYVYQVTNVEVVAPTDLAVLNQTSTPTATLITCTPPGTSWKRLVVQAKQISPDPSLATPAPASQTGGGALALPGNAPSFTNQISQGWDNIVHGVEGIFGHHTTTTQSAPPATTPTTTSPSNTATPTALPSAD